MEPSLTSDEERPAAPPPPPPSSSPRGAVDADVDIDDGDLPLGERALRLLFPRRFHGGGTAHHHHPHPGSVAAPRATPTPMSARRCLFPGPRPPLAEVIDEELGRIREAQTRKWNFDFWEFHPLPWQPGHKFRWEPVFRPGDVRVEGSRTDIYNDDRAYRSSLSSSSATAARSDGAEAEIRSRRRQQQQQQRRPAEALKSDGDDDDDDDGDDGEDVGSATVIAAGAVTCSCPSSSSASSATAAARGAVARGDDERLSRVGGDDGVDGARAGGDAPSAGGGSPRAPRQSVITEHMRPVRRTVSNDREQKPIGHPDAALPSAEDDPCPKRTRQE